MNIYKNKKEYSSPEICRIRLDNDISLALESDINPSGDPSGGGWNTQNQNGLAPDPFKSQLG